MRIAYADPPYLGCGKVHYGCPEWDDVTTHRQLVARLVAEYPDGWAISLHTPSLMTYCRFPELPVNVRFAAWVKPFAVFKPNVNPAYAWEPVVWCGGRRRGRDVPSLHDFVSEPVRIGPTAETHIDPVTGKTLVGKKPSAFSYWLFELLGLQPDDEFVDLFPGSGAVSRAWDAWRGQRTLPIGALAEEPT